MVDEERPPVSRVPHIPGTAHTFDIATRHDSRTSARHRTQSDRDNIHTQATAPGKTGAAATRHSSGSARECPRVSTNCEGTFFATSSHTAGATTRVALHKPHVPSLRECSCHGDTVLPVAHAQCSPGWCNVPAAAGLQYAQRRVRKIRRPTRRLTNNACDHLCVKTGTVHRHKPRTRVLRGTQRVVAARTPLQHAANSLSGLGQEAGL